MDDVRFDALSRALIVSRSRRATLWTLLGILLGGVMPGLSPTALAAPGKRKGGSAGKRGDDSKHGRGRRAGKSEKDRGRDRGTERARSAGPRRRSGSADVAPSVSRDAGSEEAGVASHDDCTHAGEPCTQGTECCTLKCLGNGTCSCSGANQCSPPPEPCKKSVCNDKKRCVVKNAAKGSDCPDDGNPCTKDRCNDNGTCVHPNERNGTSCGAGGTCQNGECQGETCAGTCSGCCQGETCEAGTTDALCGTGGVICDQCTDGEICDGGCREPKCGDPGASCRVFVSKAQHDANFGGLAGADQLCNDYAQAAGLPGTYMAWLSDGSASPSTRFTTQSTGPYVIVNAQEVTLTVADNWTDLTDGSLDSKIQWTEEKQLYFGSGLVWTHTFADGTTEKPGESVCSGWQSAEPDDADRGGTGDGTALDSTWTDFSTTFMFCSDAFHLYCFQQS